jgi:DNA invertase Pin-like site-specific DNA recombinase
MKYGYARVSTADQNPALQMDALKKAKCLAGLPVLRTE